MKLRYTSSSTYYNIFPLLRNCEYSAILFSQLMIISYSKYQLIKIQMNSLNLLLPSSFSNLVQYKRFITIFRKIIQTLSR